MVLCGLLKAKKPNLWLRSPQLVMAKVGEKTTAAPWLRMARGSSENQGGEVRRCVGGGQAAARR